MKGAKKTDEMRNTMKTHFYPFLTTILTFWMPGHFPNAVIQ